MKRGATTLDRAGLKNSTKITIIGTPEKAIELMHKAEAEATRRADILRARESRGPTKVRAEMGSSAGNAQFPISSNRATRQPPESYPGP
ncbi:hypothetical protein RHS01_03410 [Rhizoctonia solani]|uniref:Uncharacterized protein n=1 Tax=Rhizoctonia solani TaxID=456999 RepID=A0A8H7IFB6_9AGAM|nr:hypothetical protein RHS01_03410 [Rhizoctonia solani]